MTPKYLKIMGLALSLPSLIIGISLGMYYLADAGYISMSVALILICLCLFQIFYLIVRYARKKEN